MKKCNNVTGRLHRDPGTFKPRSGRPTEAKELNRSFSTTSVKLNFIWTLFATEKYEKSGRLNVALVEIQTYKIKRKKKPFFNTRQRTKLGVWHGGRVF